MKKLKSNCLFVWVAQGNESYGVVSAMLNLAGQVSRHGHQVRFVVFDTGTLYDTLCKVGYKCDVLSVGKKMSIRRRGIFSASLSFLINALRMARVCVSLKFYLSRAKPDYLHIVPNVLLIPGAMAARFSRVKVVFEMSNALSDNYPLDFNRRLYQFACRFSNCLVLANSAYSGTTINGRGVLPITFHLGVDAKRFEQAAVSPVTRASLGFKKDDFVVGLVARFSVEKGQLTLVRSLKRALQQDPSIRVLFVGGAGSEAYLDEVESYVVSNSLSDQVVFVGSQSNVQDYYALVDITVNLRPDAEPFGLSVVESMLMEKPVLVHALGGPAETVLDGETGWHLDDISPDRVANQIVAISRNRVALSRIGACAREHAKARFSLEAQYARYSSAIKEHFSND